MGKEEETFSWFVAWQALKRMTCRADSQKWIDKMALLWKTVFVPNFHLYFSNHYFIFSRHDEQTIFLKYTFGEIFVTPSIFFNTKASPGTDPSESVSQWHFQMFIQTTFEPLTKALNKYIVWSSILFKVWIQC